MNNLIQILILTFLPKLILTLNSNSLVLVQIVTTLHSAPDVIEMT